MDQTLLQKYSSAELVSSELEDVLSDTSLSRSQRLRRAVGIELKILFRLAAPACVVYLLNNVVSMSTQIFCGHLGNIQLAASSLGNNGIQLLAYGLLVINYYFFNLHPFLFAVSSHKSFYL